MYVDVILPLPLEGLFTYSVPGNLQDAVVPGITTSQIKGKQPTTFSYSLTKEIHHSLNLERLCYGIVAPKINSARSENCCVLVLDVVCIIDDSPEGRTVTYLGHHILR